MTISKKAKEYLQTWINSVCKGDDNPKIITKYNSDIIQELCELNLIHYINSDSYDINHIEASKHFDYEVPA